MKEMNEGKYKVTRFARDNELGKNLIYIEKIRYISKISIFSIFSKNIDILPTLNRTWNRCISLT